MEREEVKETKKTDAKKKSKDSYQIKNHFAPSKKKKTTKATKPKALREADDEVE